ncbi:MAG TPA: DUF4383 domain-containing protein [Ktedonobacterales bacterium]
MVYIEKTYALILGAVLTLIGILGFIPGLAPGGNLLGIFAIDGAHNIVHLLSGIIGIAAGLSPYARYARWYALAFGIVYGLVTIIGFIQGNTVLGLFVINTADNILHLLIAVASLAVYFVAENRERSVVTPAM